MIPHQIFLNVVHVDNMVIPVNRTNFVHFIITNIPVLSLIEKPLKALVIILLHPKKVANAAVPPIYVLVTKIVLSIKDLPKIPKLIK